MKKTICSTGGKYDNSNYPIGNDWFNFSNSLVSINRGDTFKTASYRIDKEYIFKNMSSKYFRLVEPYYYHTRNPKTCIYTYSFSLEPEELQPSGYQNFSTIKNQELIINFDKKLINNKKIKIYAISYNRIIIKDGICNITF